MGPNGCGKSNVVDAIKWALGEQSPSQMRANRMENVIFAGTQTSHRAGLAEVLIIFDNKNNVLPISSNQVSVTRRLYRTGESEYLLNNELCRLKDIVSLFVDTGLVNNASTILEQSRVDKVLSKNPTERRNPFEEAAGIVSYKEKKLECHQKILQSQKFLEQAKLANQELRAREEVLRGQVEKAQKYTLYKNQLHSLGLQILVGKFSALENESFLLQKNLLKISDDLQEMQKSQSDLAETFRQQEKQAIEQKFLQEKSQREQEILQNQVQKLTLELQKITEETQLTLQKQSSTQQIIKDLSFQADPLQKTIQQSKQVQIDTNLKLEVAIKTLDDLKKLSAQKNLQIDQLHKHLEDLKNDSQTFSQQIVLFLEKIPKNWEGIHFSPQEKKIFWENVHQIDQLLQTTNSSNFNQLEKIWGDVKNFLSQYAEFLQTEFSLQSMLLQKNSPYVQKQKCDQDSSQLFLQVQEKSKEASIVQKDIEDCNQMIQLLQKNLLNAQSQTSHLHQALLENDLKTKHAQKNLQEITDQLTCFAQTEAQSKLQLQQLQSSLQEKQCQIQPTTATTTKSFLSQTTIRELQESINSLIAKKQSMDTKLQIIHHEQKLLRKSSLDNYGDSLELLTANTSLPPETNLISLESQFKKLKIQLEQIGNVNLLAEQELTEIQAKLNKESLHIEDTLACIRQASSLEKELDTLCESRFLQTFSQVQEKFQIVFNRLFGSGVAHLSLVDPQKSLESGIEISVEIPGKKLQGIHLLSGGEKTLVAIALIFSIFLVRPAPLCILDEIDAPLDKINVDRFVYLLKDFKENTQFLLVSHNEETLAAMDYVYGVTMRNGVSQIFSMDMSHV